MTSHVQIRRAYDGASADDGYRVLVDRMWPRGVSKEAANIDEWMREISPSTDLRRWFGHDPKLWDEFRRRYRAELDELPEGTIDRLVAIAAEKKLTLVYAAKDTDHNNAVVIKELLDERSLS